MIKPIQNSRGHLDWEDLIKQAGYNSRSEMIIGLYKEHQSGVLVAKILGISAPTLYKILRTDNIDIKKYRVKKYMNNSTYPTYDEVTFDLEGFKAAGYERPACEFCSNQLGSRMNCSRACPHKLTYDEHQRAK